jgi:hypothetical protein
MCLSLSLNALFEAKAQIILKNEPIELNGQAFYVAQVSDERSTKAPSAELATKTKGNKISIVASNLEGGPALALSKYLEHNLNVDKSRWPVIIQIKDLRIAETASADGRIQGEIRLALAFGLEKPYGFEHLLDYPGRLHYARSIDNSASIERNVRSMVKGGLQYLNNWIAENAQTSVKLAKSVKISFSDYSEKVEGDTIYYSPKRPLTWSDFQSTLRPSGPYQAAVMPSIGYTQEAKVERGIVDVKLSVKAYVPKSACWASSTGRDDYALNHEQRHFDIVKIIAEQFKRKMMAKKLTPDTYEAAINMQYLDCFRDMNTMQKAYDSETGHGQNRLAQDQWNTRIDQELKSAERQNK